MPAEEVSREGQRMVWTSQTEMGFLLRMLAKDPKLTMRLESNLSHPLTTEDHPVMRHTILLSIVEICKAKAYRKKVQTSLWPLGDRELRSNMSHIFTDGHYFVIDGTSIPLLPLYVM